MSMRKSVAPISLVSSEAPKLSQQPTLVLAHARQLEVEPDGSSFRLSAPNGTVELTIRITASGPVLSFAAAAIEIAETKSFKVDAEQLVLRGREISIESTGTLMQTVAGDHITRCEGEHRVDASGIAMHSHTEPMELEAKRDLKICGERVLINC